jgi:hypothetical protein
MLNWTIGFSYNLMSGGTDGIGLNYSDDRASYVVGILNGLCEHLQKNGIRATVA